MVELQIGRNPKPPAGRMRELLCQMRSTQIKTQTRRASDKSDWLLLPLRTEKEQRLKQKDGFAFIKGLCAISAEAAGLNEGNMMEGLSNYLPHFPSTFHPHYVKDFDNVHLLCQATAPRLLLRR